MPDDLMPSREPKSTTPLSQVFPKMRSGVSVWGTKASDDLVSMIRTGWQAQSIRLATERVNASMGDLKSNNPAHGTFAHRRMRAAAINAVKEGRFESLVQSLLASRYDPTLFSQLKYEAGISLRLNIMRDILDKVDVTVSEGMNYSLTEDAGEQADQNLQNLIKATNFTSVIQRLSRECYLHKAMCAMPRVTWSERIGKRVPEICLFDPSRFDLVSMDDDGANWDLLVIYNAQATERTIYSAGGWVEQCLDEGKGDWKDESFGAYEDGGGIDAVIFKPNTGTRWNEEAYGSGLAESTIQANAAETFIDWLMSTQVKMPVGDMDSSAKGQILAQGKALNLGVNGSVSMLDFQLNLPALVDIFITRERDNAAKAIGLSGAEWSTAVAPATSGVAERIKFWARDRNAIARREWVLPQSKQLYWVLQKVAAREITTPVPVIVNGDQGSTVVMTVLPIAGFDGGWTDTGGPVPPPFTPPNPQDVLPPYEPGTSIDQQPIDLMIDVRDVGYPEAPLEKIAMEKNDLDRGFTTEATLLLERNPDLETLDAAREQLIKNKEENAKMAKVGAPEPVGPITPSLSADIKAPDPLDPAENDPSKPSNPVPVAAHDRAPPGFAK